MRTINHQKEIQKTNGLKKLSQKFKWFLFTELQDLKLTSEYINFICPDENRKSFNQIEDLRKLIEQSLIREFSPKIQESKSFDIIVDMVMHNIQKKSLKNDTSEFFINNYEGYEYTEEDFEE